MSWLDSEKSAFEYLLSYIGPYNSYYTFNIFGAVDADYWTSAGDVGGGFDIVTGDDEHVSFKLYTSGVNTEEWYIIADGDQARVWAPINSEYDTVTVDFYMKMNTTDNTQALWGLTDADLAQRFITYQEPAIDSAFFYVDDGVEANYFCRSLQAGEEQSSSGVPLDTEAWHTFTLVWTTASVIFKIDDSVVATHSTQVPTTPLMIMMLIKTEENNEKGIEIEYVKVTVD